MSIKTIIDATKDKLLEIPNIGFVETRQGRKEDLPFPLPLWTVSVSGSGLARIEQPLGKKCKERVLRIRGWMPYNFEAASDDTWISYLDAVEQKLTPVPALSVCAYTETPRLLDNAFGDYGVVFCHFAQFEFRTQEWV